MSPGSLMDKAVDSGSPYAGSIPVRDIVCISFYVENTLGENY